MIFWDTEGHLFDRGLLAPPLVCLQSAQDDGPISVELWRTAQNVLEYWLKRGEHFCGAYLAHDFACVMQARPDLIPFVFSAYDEGRVHDILLDGKLLDIAAGAVVEGAVYSLATMAERIGISLDKGADTWRLRYRELEDIEVADWPAEALEYCRLDVSTPRSVYKVQQQTRAQWQAQGLDPLGVHSAYAAQASLALHLASCHGFLTDPERTAALAESVERYHTSLKKQLTTAGLVRPPPDQQVRRFDKNGKKKPKTKEGSRDIEAASMRMVDACTALGREIALTDKGRVSLDHDACILSEDPDLEAYAEYTSLSTLRARVGRMSQGHTLPLQPSFDALKETARTSSFLPKAPIVGEQAQTFPQAPLKTCLACGSTQGPHVRKCPCGEKKFKDERVGLRECPTPRPGMCFVGGDFAQAEMHTLAQCNYTLFGFSEMGDLLKKGVDLHWHFAASSLGMSYEEIRAREKEFKDHRKRAKPANFGFPGGMGPAKFVLYSRGYGVSYTEQEARQTKEKWIQTFPENEHYFNWIKRQLRDGQFTHVHPVTQFIRGGCRLPSGANQGFQHLCAYGAKAALWAVVKACFDVSSPLLGYRVWNFIHDEILLEGPIDTAHEAALELARLMEQAFNQWVPDSPTTVDPFVTMVWSKKMDAPAKDAQGRFIPWQLP